MTEASHRNFIAGEWREASAVATARSPASPADVIGEYAMASPSDVREAADAARHAFQVSASWGVQARADALQTVAAELLASRAAFASMIAREVGKPLREAELELVRAANIFRYFAGECVRLRGTWMESVRGSVSVQIRHEPLGVVALITPWNFPIAIPAWKIAPALAYGNAVVFKPAELGCACAWALTEVLSRAGIPAGLFNLVMGTGADAGAELASRADIDALSFTGSRLVGERLRIVAAGRGLPLQLEMGGKNALVVMEDADLDLAARCAVDGAYGFAGQRCTASSRLIVCRSVAQPLVERLVAGIAALQVGDPLRAETNFGPVVSDAQLWKSQFYTKLGVEEGAGLLLGGTPLPERDRGGFYFAPTLLTSTTSTMRINREEIFGPIATILEVRDFEHALEVTNDSDYGLVAGICTRSLMYAERFQRAARVGMTMLNLPTAGVDYHVPFGGARASSYGPREQGAEARFFYTRSKTCYELAS